MPPPRPLLSYTLLASKEPGACLLATSRVNITHNCTVGWANISDLFLYVSLSKTVVQLFIQLATRKHLNVSLASQTFNEFIFI